MQYAVLGLHLLWLCTSTPASPDALETPTQTEGNCPEPAGKADAADIAINLLQRSVVERRGELYRPGSNIGRTDRESCVDLQNEESYFTAAIKIGTPSQIVNMVADTGSTAFVVESCVCKDMGFCETSSHCFKGSDSASSTFNMDADAVSYVVSYGSGDLMVTKASDVVRLGKVEARMDGSLMLMTESQMDIPPPEGILGLGIPEPGETDGFLQVAHIDRYSLCFNDNGTAGSLRLSMPRAALHLGQIGRQHWALDFRGASVGFDKQTALSVQICSTDDENAGQETPCAAIPDSGTTFILVPKEHFPQLHTTLCEAWPRCANATTDEMSNIEKSRVFDDLLTRCGEWLTEDKGIDEIPPLHLHFAGSGGEAQTISLTAWSWVLEAEVPPTSPSSEDMPSGGKTCALSMSESDYTTAINGPVWVVGMPLFYQYQVGFDLGTKPASLSFTEGSCTSCNDRANLMSSEHLHRSDGKHKAKKMRKLHKPPRKIKIDTSKPI